GVPLVVTVYKRGKRPACHRVPFIVTVYKRGKRCARHCVPSGVTVYERGKRSEGQVVPHGGSGLAGGGARGGGVSPSPDGANGENGRLPADHFTCWGCNGLASRKSRGTRWKPTQSIGMAGYSSVRGIW